MVAEPISIAAPMVAPTPKKLWTYDEIQATFDDDVRRELYDGEIFIMPAPVLEHQDAVGNLFFLFRLWIREHGGKTYLAPIDLQVSARRSFQPDLLFYSAQTLAEKPVLDDPQKLRVAPDLIVEVISPGTARNDRVRKLRIYAEFGVNHYWLIDPENRSIQLLELREDNYLITHSLEEGETFEPSLFLGLSIAVSHLFEANQ